MPDLVPVTLRRLRPRHRPPATVRIRSVLALTGGGHERLSSRAPSLPMALRRTPRASHLTTIHRWSLLARPAAGVLRIERTATSRTILRTTVVVAEAPIAGYRTSRDAQARPIAGYRPLVGGGGRVVAVGGGHRRIEAPRPPADTRIAPAAALVGSAGARGPAGPPGAGGIVMVRRSAAPSSRPAEAGPAPVAAPAEAGRVVPALAAPAAQPDLDEIASQVIRHIERRAVAQRERLARG